MRRHWKYLLYVLRHKWFVFIAGLQLGVPILSLIIHDWDKFLPSMWFAYARTFYAPDGKKQYDDSPAFTAAWNGHQKRNKHHWQYWVILWDSGGDECIPMPERHILEMIADWRGAGRANGNLDTLGWYALNYDKIRLHEDTRAIVDKLLTGWETPLWAVRETETSGHGEMSEIVASFRARGKLL